MNLKHVRRRAVWCHQMKFCRVADGVGPSQAQPVLDCPIRESGHDLTRLDGWSTRLGGNTSFSEVPSVSSKRDKGDPNSPWNHVEGGKYPVAWDNSSGIAEHRASASIRLFHLLSTSHRRWQSGTPPPIALFILFRLARMHFSPSELDALYRRCSSSTARWPLLDRLGPAKSHPRQHMYPDMTIIDL